jgi:hypothetical protein
MLDSEEQVVPITTNDWTVCVTRRRRRLECDDGDCVEASSINEASSSYTSFAINCWR